MLCILRILRCKCSAYHFLKRVVVRHAHDIHGDIVVKLLNELVARVFVRVRKVFFVDERPGRRIMICRLYWKGTC